MSLGQKLLYIAGIILAVIFTFVIMLALQPSINEIVAVADNATDWSGSPEFAMARGVMVSMPVWQWLLPPFIGLLAIVLVFRSPTAS